MTGEPINSRKAYQMIARASRRWLCAAGLEARGTSGLWVRAEGEKQELNLRFQCDKNGWDWDGSQFTLNFDLLDTQDRQRPLRACRYHKLVDAADGFIWVALTNRVVTKIRQVEQPPLDDGENTEEREWSLESATTFSPADDPWMRFYDEGDIVAWWAEFIEPHMDRMLARFLGPR